MTEDDLDIEVQEPYHLLRVGRLCDQVIRSTGHVIRGAGHVIKSGGHVIRGAGM